MIIFGAGVVGEALFYACQDKGIKVDSFFDHNPNKNSFMGLPVRHYLEKDHYLISTADIGDVLEYLQSTDYSDCTELLKDFDPAQYPFSLPPDFVKYAIDTAITCHEWRGKRFLHSVDLIITERCTMKCRDCSNLMQYYKHPKDCDTGQLMKDIDALFSQYDFISEVRVLGGEPFINKDWHIIVSRLLYEPKLNYVVIYTNGTIDPKRMDFIGYKHKLMVLATDYGILSKNIGALKKLCQSNCVPYYSQKVGGWTACSDIIQHNRTPEENYKLFKSCCVHNLKTLSNGKLYECPFEANMARLGYEFTDACDWCNGRPFGAPTIEPAIQR